MPGDGTKTAFTTSNPPARLLELTRAVSVHSGRPTGVDRVCLAYLEAVIRTPEPCFGLARTRFGYVLLDRDGMRAVLARLRGEVPWAREGVVTRMLRRAGWFKPVVEQALRRACVARCTPSFLGRMLRRHLPEGTVYINVDQANISDRKLAAIKGVAGARITLFLHDTIPLDHPEYQTPKTHVRFKAMLEEARVHADLILTNSIVSMEAIARHMSPNGAVPEIVVAHLGVKDDFFQSANSGRAPDVPQPYFVTLGTIEPRKNHALLLDVWDRMATEGEVDLPHLVIVGRRGWMVDELLQRMEQSPLYGRYVHEFNGLDDGAVFALLRDACAMLFPSKVEGYGLPPVEAAMLGTPVICSDLPVMREILKDYPIYAGVSDSYSWENAIRSAVLERAGPTVTGQRVTQRFDPPTWEAHFNTVLRVT